MNTPEEIARYRLERRKNFPTEVNIKRKLAEEAEQRRRGEIPPAKHGRRGGASWMPVRQPVAPPPLVPKPHVIAALAAYANSDDDAPPEVSAKTPLPRPGVPDALEEGEIRVAPKQVRTREFMRAYVSSRIGDAHTSRVGGAVEVACVPSRTLH